jgi:SAM-dependent methyltransferase
MADNSPNVEFDFYASNYDAALAEGLSVSGENKEYFARGRIAWLARCLKWLHIRPKSVLDFGCGTGTAVPFLLELLAAEIILGLDISTKSLTMAQQQYGSQQVQFLTFDRYQPHEEMHLTYCNGVFHHIPPTERTKVVAYIAKALRPGGLFALWENNPWNPGTRYVMSRIPFDRDAITLSPSEARRLLRAGGFEILRTDYLFVFPRLLRLLRGLELSMSRLPCGAQYQILARKA